MDFPSDWEPESSDPVERPGRPTPATRPDPRPRQTPPDLGGLPVAGITRRRVAWLLGALVSIWIVSVFARQVGDAGAAVDRADRLRFENAGPRSKNGTALTLFVRVTISIPKLS